MTQTIYHYEKLKNIYEKVVEEPNKNTANKGFIKCPECGEEILMIPTLKVMHVAIENHVNNHRALPKANPIKQYQIAISVRLALVEQVLRIACKIHAT